MATTTLTLNELITKYSADVAFVAEEAPAANVDDLAHQLIVASERLDVAGINNADDLDTAAIYLRDALHADDATQAALVKKATGYLRYVPDMVDEYRDMV